MPAADCFNADASATGPLPATSAPSTTYTNLQVSGVPTIEYTYVPSAAPTRVKKTRAPTTKPVTQAPTAALTPTPTKAPSTQTPTAVLTQNPTTAPLTGTPSSVAPTQQQPVVVACVGDSITFGCCGLPATDSYPAQLQALLGPRYKVHNFGKSGTFMAKGSTMSYWTQPEFQAALHSAPQVVLLMLGTNDATSWNRDQYATDYNSMVTTFQALPSRPIVQTMLCPPVYGGGMLPFKSTVNSELPSMTRAIAQGRALTAPIDLFSLFAQHCSLDGGARCDWISDGYHPTADGYKAIARVTAQALRALGRSHETPSQLREASITLKSPEPEPEPAPAPAPVAEGPWVDISSLYPD